MQSEQLYVVGAWTAKILLAVGSLVCLLLNIPALHRRRTNARCVIAIMLTLGAILSVTLLWMISGAKTLDFGPILFLIPACFFLLVGSVICAIIGLFEYSDRRGHYSRGRKRAIASLVLNVIWVSCVLFSWFKTPVLTQAVTATPEEPATNIQNAEWNFRIDVPKHWASVTPGLYSASARAAINRHEPDMSAMILADKATEKSIEASMKLVKEQIKRDGTPEFLAERDSGEGGVAGRLLETRFHGPQGEVFYQHWLTLKNGTLYQVITWGPPANAEDVRDEAEKIVDSFRFLDSGPSTSSSPGSVAASTISPYTSERFNYRVDLATTPWIHHWTNLAASSPLADFGATNSARTGYFCVIPVWVGNDEVDLGTLTTVLANRVGITYPGEGISNERPVGRGPLKGRAFVYERNAEGIPIAYHVRVMRQGNFAYLLASWMDRRLPSFSDDLEAALSHVTFFEQERPSPLLENVRERERHTLVYNEIGLILDRAEQNDEARKWFKKSYDITRHNATILTNYVQSCIKCSLQPEALAVLEAALPRFPGNQKLASLQAGLQYETGDIDASLKTYQTLFEKGWKSDGDFNGYVWELMQRNQYDEALRIIDQYSSGHATVIMQRLRAQVLVAKGETSQAIEILTALRERSPNDQPTSLALADAYLTAKQGSEALAESERMISLHHETAEILRRKGLAELSLKHYREAKTTLEKALAKAPTSVDLRRLVDGMSGLLGEGSNSYVKTPIEPVEIPAELRQGAIVDPADEYLHGYSAWYRNVVKAITYHKGKELKTTDQEVIEIRDQQGVEKFSSLEFAFDPLGEQIFVNDVTVRDASGAVISRGKVDDSYVVDDGGDQAASQAKVLHVPVPGLRPGSTLEYTITRRETGPVKTFTFKNCAMLKGLPVLRTSLQVQADANEFRWESTPGVPAPQKEDGRITWTVERPAVYRWEPLQAPVETFVPMVSLAAASATWPGEGKEYLGLIKERLEIEPAIRAAAEEAIKGQTTSAAKIAALARFVQRGLTYKAIEFGRRARLPNSAAQVLRNKYGDCKDHALLLCQLLESAGIPAHPALVRSSGDLQARLPSLDQFDHMIAYIPGINGGQFIDCTGKSTDLRLSPPLGLASRQALILDPKAPYLQTIPACGPDASSINAEREVSLVHDSDAMVKETVTFRGEAAASMRAILLAVESPQRLIYLQRMMTAETPSVSLQEAKIDDLDDPQVPLCLHLRYTLPSRFHSVGGHLAGQLPAVWECLYVTDSPVEKRFSPFKVKVPNRITSTATFTLPAGWRVAPAKLSPVKSPYLEGAAKDTSDPSALHVESQLMEKAGQFPAEQYTAYIEAARKTRSLAEQDVVLERR